MDYFCWILCNMQILDVFCEYWHSLYRPNGQIVMRRYFLELQGLRASISPEIWERNNYIDSEAGIVSNSFCTMKEKIVCDCAMFKNKRTICNSIMWFIFYLQRKNFWNSAEYGILYGIDIISRDSAVQNCLHPLYVRMYTMFVHFLQWKGTLNLQNAI
jgi:hypothetical protein